MSCHIAFPLQHWTGPILPQSQEQPWPEERDDHKAYSMWDPDSDPQHPCIVMVGGRSRQDEPLGDVWLFHVNNIQWEEVSLLRVNETVHVILSP